MAGRYGSQSVWLLVSGYNLIANSLQGLRHKIESINEATHGVGVSWEESTPVGMARVEVAQEGAYFDTQTGYIHDMMAGYPGALTPQSTARVCCLGFSGMTLGEKFFGSVGDINQDYEVLGKTGALQRANMTHKITGQMDEGVILHTTTTAETADVNAGSGNSVDNSTVPQIAIPITSSSVANPSVITTPVPHGLTTGDTVVITGHSGSTPSINSEKTATVTGTFTFTIATNVTGGGTGGTFTRGETNGGAVAYIQWPALTLGGHTAASVIFRHSVDNSTFADLVTMTSATATRGGERKTVAGEVRRYTAVSIDFTGAGSPSMNLFAGLARNP